MLPNGMTIGKAEQNINNYHATPLLQNGIRSDY